MLNVKLITIGKLKEKWLTDGICEYEKRLKAFCKFDIVELKEYRLSENPSEKEIQKGLEEEGKAILAEIAKESSPKVIAMCIEGNMLSSVELCHRLQQFAQTTANIIFVIGGSFGIDVGVKQVADLKLSVSPMTFPHQLFRLMLTEQIYRAFGIMNNSKYHK